MPLAATGWSCVSAKPNTPALEWAGVLARVTAQVGLGAVWSDSRHLRLEWKRPDVDAELVGLRG